MEKPTEVKPPEKVFIVTQSHLRGLAEAILAAINTSANASSVCSELKGRFEAYLGQLQEIPVAKPDEEKPNAV